MRLCIVIVNFRTPGLVLDALESLDGQLDPERDAVVVVDNGSGDDSADRIERALRTRGFGAFCRVERALHNRGYSAGTNIGIRAIEASYYLLLNADTRMRPGAIARLLAQMHAHPGVGIAGPRLEWPDGRPQVSCFRDMSPISEFLAAAQTPALDGALRNFEVDMPISDEPQEVQWLSFACAMVRREVIEKVGLLDEEYFMYFEDSDYCRAARMAGFRIYYFPSARVVHLRHGEGRDEPEARRRPPRYLYASRALYFRKGYGSLGLLAANALWYIGRSVSLARELVGHKAPHTCEKEWLDNWTDTFKLSH
jgi:N-acetylglucosaminyl-diphospho-decaprenol L-rhamnosyltransferase